MHAAATQVVVAGTLLGGALFLGSNAADALQRMGVSTGFGFLSQSAGFGIGESAIRYEPQDSYLRAYVVGLLNTLEVSLAGLLVATVLGGLVGVGRLSRNLFVSTFAALYVQVFRNTPQLLQIVFWYAVATHLPRPREALRPLPGVYMSNRGVFLPSLGDAGWVVAAAALLGCVAVMLLRRGLRSRGGVLLLAAAFPALAWVAVGGPVDWPELRGMALRGGTHLSPEFLALLLGLGLYIAAFIAEIVRAGILSVPRGEVDAAYALGLRWGQVCRLVLIPQGLRLMVPPAAGQYVSLVKNSSLAVAIGYPDLVNIGNTTINQTGQVAEGVLMITVVYLSISLLIAVSMNNYNRVLMARFGRG